jgi:ligand-binding sensor domain-containing protein
LWIATDGFGVSRFDGQGWKNYSTADGLASGSVFAIAVAPENTVWIGTYAGVSRFDGQTWKTYTVKDGLANNLVWSLGMAQGSVLWAGTAHGASRFVGGKWESFTEKSMKTLAVAPDGKVWFGFGQSGKGLMSFDGGTWQTVVPDDKSAHVSLNALAVAPDGVFWLATEDDGRLWTKYAPTDGLTDKRVSSVAVAADSSAWVGAGAEGVGGGGLSHFSPPK